MSPVPFKYKRPLVSFMAILLLFLIVADVLIVSGQRRQMQSELKKHWRLELDMKGIFITEYLLKHEYANVENFLIVSAKENPYVVEFTAVTPDNFVLAHYKREKPSADTFILEKQIQYGGEVLLNIKVVKDFEPEENILRNLRLQLVVVSVLLTAFMGIAIWFSIRRGALLPLEREITERMRAEELLRKAKDELERKVQERTSELREINDNLLLEISERKRAEEFLRESEERLRMAVSGGRVGIWEWDVATNQLDWNDQLKAIFGLSENVTGLTLEKFISAIYPDDLAVTEHSFRTALEQHTEFHREYRILWPDGSVHWIVAIGRGFYDTAGRPLRMLGCAMDITVRKKTEENLHALLSRQKALLEAIPDIIMEVDSNKVYTWANQAGIQFFGEDVIGKEATYYFDGDQATYNVVQPLFNGSEDVIYIESWQRRKDGQKRLLAWWCKVIKDESGNVAGALSSARDVTERNQAEEEKERLQAQLLQAQKMESIGILAGGVAHDFNNILCSIVGYAHVLLMKMKADDPLRMYIEQILASSDRAINLTKSLLAFGRKQVTQMKHVKINDIVSGIKKILDRIIGEDIHLQVYPAVNDLIINADMHQIEQVLMNLATNARDAMPDGGTLTITTGELEIDEKYIQTHHEGKVGKYAVLSITDTGTGMDEETKKNIFDPFFTTKEVGKGTGLGLAMIYGTIKQHNGFINVYSKPGEGSTFKIYLPLAESEVKVTEKNYAASIPSGTETILLVEDDEDVRKSTKIILKEFGYTVIEAANVKQAVELFRENMDRVQLVISDIIMPGKSGKDLHNELTEITPDVKVIFVSGYPADALAKKGIIDSDVNFIYKPAKPEVLLQKVREVLDT